MGKAVQPTFTKFRLRHHNAFVQIVFIKMKRIFSTKIIQSKGQNAGNTKDGKKSSNSDLCNCLLLKFFNNSQSVFQNTRLQDFELCLT